MKPRIIVLSRDGDDAFKWMSDGWFQVKQMHDPAAWALMDRAHAAIAAGTGVLDVIQRLEAAGFEVVREEGDLIDMEEE